MVQPAQRVLHFTESVIREVTRWADESGALNLAQGFPDYDPPALVLEAAASISANLGAAPTGTLSLAKSV